MKRAQIYLEDAEYEALREAAFKRRTSISGVLRHLIQVSIVGKPAKSKKRYAAGLLELAGIFHDTRRDISEPPRRPEATTLIPSAPRWRDRLAVCLMALRYATRRWIWSAMFRATRLASRSGTRIS